METRLPIVDSTIGSSGTNKFMKLDFCIAGRITGSLLLTALVLIMPKAFGEPMGRIAFLRGETQAERCVHVTDLESGETIQVGPGDHDGPPVWSPDGYRLAFTTREGDGLGIMVVRPDGTDGRMLHTEAAWNRELSWSPDNRRIAYMASEENPETGTLRVYDLETDTETEWGGGQAGLLQPVWLGESLLIALLQAQLERLDDAEAEMWRGIDPDPRNTLLVIGMIGEPGALTTHPFAVTRDHALPFPMMFMPSRGNYVEWNIAIHPRGGRYIAFESNDGGDREIYNLTQRGAFNLSNHRAADWNPVWSPRGDWLAFESFRSGRRGVFRVNPDTALVLPVAVSEAADFWDPTWSPDGRWIACVSTALVGMPQVVLVNLRDDSIQRLTLKGQALAPAWQPGDRR